MKPVIAAVVVAALSGSAWAAPQSSPQVLKEGKYRAKVAALACAACAAEVESTLKAVKGVEDVSVDQKSSTVAFAVKKGARVSVARLQRTLKSASDKMGMGADYTLKDLKAQKG